MSREVLQVADAVRAAQAPGPVLPSAAASTRTLSSASAPTARAPPQGFVQAANLVTGAGWSEAAQPQAPVVTPEDAVRGGFRGIAASESFDIGDDVDTSIETPAARATPSAPCDRDEAGGPPPAARQRREGPSELVSNETQLLEASEESSRMPVDGHSGLSQGMAAMDVSERAQHFCPVPGCPAAAGGRRPGWDTDGPGLRAHVDAICWPTRWPPTRTLDESARDGRLQDLWPHGEPAVQRRSSPHMPGYRVVLSAGDRWACSTKFHGCR